MDIVVSPSELPREKPIIDKFLQKYFFPELAILEAFGLKGSRPPAIPSNSDLVVKAEAGGELVGVTYCTTSPTTLWDRNQSAQHCQLVDFFTFVEQDSKMHELPGRPLEAWLTGVHSEWRSHGIATRLAEEVCRLAPGLGYSAVTALCISAHAAAIARRLGWRQLYRLAYADYPKLSGRQVNVKPTPPHNHVYLFTKEL